MSAPAPPIQPAAQLPATTDVLVVGAGPTGLALATALSRLGVDVTAIDIEPQVRTDSRAAGVQPRTLEDLARIGAAEPLIKRGLRGAGFRVSNRDGLLLDIPFAGLDTPYPYILLVPQSETEQVLRAALTDAGGRVWAGHRLLDLRQEFNAVATLVADPAGAVRSIRARYVVGCDGLHSGVRGHAGIAFEGQSRPQDYALADVRMTKPADVPRVTFTFAPEGMLLQSALPDGMVRVVASVPAGTGALDATGLQKLIDTRCAPTDRATVAEVVRSSPYHVTSRLASAFSRDRVFLAGDAAHVHSPAGGQGMNTGIQDAINLSWKLKAVLDGADPGLLDSYDAERRPNAAALLAFTGQLTSVAELRDPQTIQLRDDILTRVRDLASLPAMLATRLSQLDVHPQTSPTIQTSPTSGASDANPDPLVGRRLPPAAPWGQRLAWARLVPPAQRSGSGTVSAQHSSAQATADSTAAPGMAEYDSPSSDTIIVRPDGYVAAVEPPASQPHRLKGHLVRAAPPGARKPTFRDREEFGTAGSTKSFAIMKKPSNTNILPCAPESFVT